MAALALRAALFRKTGISPPDITKVPADTEQPVLEGAGLTEPPATSESDLICAIGCGLGWAGI